MATPSAPAPPSSSVAPDELIAAIDAGHAPAILDVRSGWEFTRGRVPGATHIPFWTVLFRASEIRSPKDAPLVVYCGHGPRAWMAAAALRRHGFRHLIYLRGHMAGWRRARLREQRS